MNRPNAASPSPISSGCWCPLGFRVRFLTRDGVFGRTLRGRFLAATRTLSGAGGPFLRRGGVTRRRATLRERALEDARCDRAFGHVRVRRVVEDGLVESRLAPAPD